MKKRLLILCLIAAGIHVNAQTPLIENFNYGTNDSLAAVTVNNGWVNTATTLTNAIRATGSGLTYTGYVGSGVGNSASLANNGQDVYRTASANYTSGSVFASALVNLSAAQANGDYFFAMIADNSTTNYVGRVFARLNGTAVNFGLSKGNETYTSFSNYSTTAYSTSTTYLIVLKYTFNTGSTADDSVSLYVFSSGIPATMPSTPTVGPLGSTVVDAPNIGRVVLRQGSSSNAPTMLVDAIRFSGSWANGPLPVTLNSFKGVLENHNVQLFWSTSSEINNKGYEVERSKDGNAFETIGFVAGAGNSNKLVNYQYSDKNIHAALLYYRLKQIDYDGNFKYSEIVTLNNEDIKVVISPNPFTNEINVVAASSGQTITAEIIDITGKTQKVQTGTGKITVPTQDLPHGVYFISIDNGEKVFVKRIIKN